MSAVGLWTLGLAAAYTAFLVLANRRLARRPAEDRAASFFVGGRRFSAWTVTFCITGLFSGSSFISVLELSYLTGVSALWYGVAETVQILLIALLLVKPLRKRLVVTVTGIIGDRFGRAAKLVAGTITAITFPMWSVATTIAFASALHVFTDLSLPLSVTVTAVLLLAFLSAGGMQSVGFNQTMNCLLFAVMAVVGVSALLSAPGRAALAELPVQRPDLLDPLATGPALILAWFGTFLVNVPLAQAAFQMSLSARSPEEGQRGMVRAAALGAPFIVLGAIIGCAAAIAVPSGDRGLEAVPRFLAEALPAPLVALFFLGIWACALGWAGPCQFSGATSLGRDVGSALRPNATPEQLVRWTRWSLVALTALMILFAVLRTEQSAWWNILAWTLRNGATLAPVLAAFAWPLATRTAAGTSMIAGFGAGLAWYQLSDWSVSDFHLGVHPVWVGMSVNVIVLVLVTLVQAGSRTAWRADRGGVLALVGALILPVVTALGAPVLHPLGLTGPAVLATTVLVLVAAVRCVHHGGDAAGRRGTRCEDLRPAARAATL
ncbi:sodium:solute symporter [Brachybacterium vulturis]|uniref:Sodium:solute symporter n=1 Tax=Brachybacterium vulturis TaxID=2017484 RepID=A0A291GPC9_9MICO|nr:sodium:solute symporter family protein [Brachybacterium vulturis]ATG51824.1 sodium:solute symporter [Brachybacterium vulturis]